MIEQQLKDIIESLRSNFKVNKNGAIAPASLHKDVFEVPDELLLFERAVDDLIFIENVLNYVNLIDIFNDLQTEKNKLSELYDECQSNELANTIKYINNQYDIFSNHMNDEVEFIDYLMQSDRGLRGSLLDIWQQTENIHSIAKINCDPCSNGYMHKDEPCSFGQESQPGYVGSIENGYCCELELEI